ncbi:MAG: DUF4124 domain-containing protein [Betaproteobacteria bacterium]
MKRRLILVACAALWIATGHAADIYEWVDDQGGMHVSDTVPDKYKSRARKIDTRNAEVSPQQRSEAEARAAKDKELVEKAQAEADAARTRARNDPVPRDPATAPRAAPKPADDCPTLQRLFKESQDCFAPFRRDDGTVKPEAFQKCKDLPDPSYKCGLPATPR